MLSEIEKENIKNAIAEAEKTTSGEIVPMLIQKSDFYPASHFRAALLLGLLIPMIMYYIPYDFDDPIWYLWAQLPAILIGYLLAYHPRVKKFFSTKAEISEEVRQKAIESFFYNNLHHTKERTGILIMISMLERRVEILADSGINMKVEKNTWNKVVKNLTKSIKSGSLANGFIESINECGNILTEHFPAEKENVDELSNEVIVE